VADPATRAVLAQVEQRELIDLASALIRIPSFKTEETAVATIRGSADEDDACVLVSEMETVARVLAVTALDVCRRRPAELAWPPAPA
jgi:hypothetical protein